MGETINDVVFVYSESQIAAANKVYSAAGKKFVCGLVSVGNTHKKYSKMITINKLDAMMSQYADTKVICYGNKLNTKYTKPTFAYAN